MASLQLSICLLALCKTLNCIEQFILSCILQLIVGFIECACQFKLAKANNNYILMSQPEKKAVAVEVAKKFGVMTSLIHQVVGDQEASISSGLSSEKIESQKDLKETAKNEEKMEKDPQLKQTESVILPENATSMKANVLIKILPSEAKVEKGLQIKQTDSYLLSEESLPVSLVEIDSEKLLVSKGASQDFFTTLVKELFDSLDIAIAAFGKVSQRLESGLEVEEYCKQQMKEAKSARYVLYDRFSKNIST